MWSEALAFLAGAERRHRRFSAMADSPGWAPPVDLYECGGDLALTVALPGATPEHVEVVVDAGVIMIRGERTSGIPQATNILRLEIPYGRFERLVALPPGNFSLATQEIKNGCLTLILRRVT
jgi:HSP20 family molecular chaperone IbpA